MSFRKRAWSAAADEYGRRRAERYGRFVNILTALGWTAAAILLLFTVFAAEGRFGG